MLFRSGYNCNGSLYCKLILLWQSKPLCFLCDFSNIQKCSFKECPLTWVAPLTMFLPITTWPLWSDELVDDSIGFIHHVKIFHLLPTIITKHIFSHPKPINYFFFKKICHVFLDKFCFTPLWVVINGNYNMLVVGFYF